MFSGRLPLGRLDLFLCCELADVLVNFEVSTFFEVHCPFGNLILFLDGICGF